MNAFSRAILLVATICLLASLAHSQGIPPQAIQRPDGFLNYMWGTPKTDSLEKALNLVYSGRPNVPYKRYTALNIMRFGKAHVQVNFYFYKNQLSAVALRTKGTQNSIDLIAELEDIYGKGGQPNKWREQYRWAFGNTFIDYDMDVDTYVSFTLFRSQRLDYIQNEDRTSKRLEEYKKEDK